MDYKIIWIVGKNNWNMNEGYKLRIKTFIQCFLIIVKSYYLLVSQLASGKKIWPLIKSRSVRVCYRIIGGNARFLLYSHE